MDKQQLRKARRIFQALLQEERRQRVSIMGVDIESLIVEGHTMEAWVNPEVVTTGQRKPGTSH